jgi:predicted transcriptional regulator
MRDHVMRLSKEHMSARAIAHLLGIDRSLVYYYRKSSGVDEPPCE